MNEDFEDITNKINLIMKISFSVAIFCAIILISSIIYYSKIQRTVEFTATIKYDKLVITHKGLEEYKQFIEKYNNSVKIKIASMDISNIRSALARYRTENGKFPTSETGLRVLVTNVYNAETWRGPYLYEVPLDPWGNDYIYKSPGIYNINTFDLYSRGPDGIMESVDDIVNWTSQYNIHNISYIDNISNLKPQQNIYDISFMDKI